MKTMDDIREKYEDEILFMFATFADPNELIDGDDTILHVAVLRNDIEVIDVLIAHGADVNRTGGLGVTPLHVACSHGCLEAAKRLLAEGAELTPVNNFGFTALENARNHNHDEIVQFLESRIGSS